MVSRVGSRILLGGRIRTRPFEGGNTSKCSKWMKSSKLSCHTMNLKIPFMHYNVKSHTPFMSSDIKINLNGKGRIWLFFFQFHTIGHKSPHCVNFGNYNSPWCVWGLCSPFPRMIGEGSYIHQRSAEWPLQLSVFTVRKRNCGKVMVSQACVKNSAHGGRCTPPDRHTPH